MLSCDANLNRGVSVKEYSLRYPLCYSIEYYRVVFRIIQYSVFSDIKELDDQVFSGRQLAHGIAAGTTIILEVPPRSEPQCLAYQNCLNSKRTIPNL